MSRRTVRDALPYILTPPRPGLHNDGVGILKRPIAVHRLDGPTSGLLLVAKTKIALDSLHKQFAERTVQKIYTAVINGDLSPDDETNTSYGDGVELTNTTTERFNFIDYPLGGKQASTSWRILRKARSLNAKDGILTLVELRPHTGRYHQLRRHMAWFHRRPLVGDPLYAGAFQAHHFRRRGLFLCSNGVAFRHPCTLRDVTVSLDLPRKFGKLLDGEEQWAILRTTTALAAPPN